MTPIERPLNHLEVLSAVPVRNAAVTSERDTSGLVLHVPLQRRWWMDKPFCFFFPVRTRRNFALDGLGEEVWQACNGVDCLEAIIDAFAKRHRIRFHDARLGVVSFLRMLIERKLVVLDLTRASGTRHLAVPSLTSVALREGGQA